MCFFSHNWEPEEDGENCICSDCHARKQHDYVFSGSTPHKNVRWDKGVNADYDLVEYKCNRCGHTKLAYENFRSYARSQNS